MRFYMALASLAICLLYIGQTLAAVNMKGDPDLDTTQYKTRDAEQEVQQVPEDSTFYGGAPEEVELNSLEDIDRHIEKLIREDMQKVNKTFHAALMVWYLDNDLP